MQRTPRAQVSRELEQSRKALQQRFAVPVDSFAYPFGIYLPEQVVLVEAAGYSSAVTTDEGVEATQAWKARELKRVKISGKDSRLAFVLRMRNGRRGWR